MELVIASRNVHKIREYREMLKRFKHLDVLSLLQFPDCPPLKETGATFQENARLKAQHTSKHLTHKDCWILADDSGLVVPLLNGAPGVLSNRYAGDDASEADNRHKLLRAMQGLTGVQRHAYYECSLIVYRPESIEKCVTAVCEGKISTEERGRNGFGYDSLFIKHDYDKTFGEMDETTKIRISHRYKAFEKLSVTLETLRS